MGSNKTLSLTSKIYLLVYTASRGAIFGAAFAILLSRWTWLELRFNVGLLFPTTIIICLAVFLLKTKLPNPIWGWVAVVTLTAALPITAGLNISNMLILLGTVLREGIMLDSLPVKYINAVIMLIVLLNIVLTCLVTRRMKREKSQQQPILEVKLGE